MDTYVPQAERPIALQECADLAIDAWRAVSRACADPQTPERVATAIMRISERMQDLGFMTKDLTGVPYAPDMRARIVEQVGIGPPFRVIECLAPAVYFRGKLVRPAEIVVKGEAKDDQADR